MNSMSYFLGRGCKKFVKSRTRPGEADSKQPHVVDNGHDASDRLTLICRRSGLLMRSAHIVSIRKLFVVRSPSQKICAYGHVPLLEKIRWGVTFGVRDSYKSAFNFLPAFNPFFRLPSSENRRFSIPFRNGGS